MSTRADAATRARLAARMTQATGTLTTAVMAEMDTSMPWFRDLSAESRSYVGLILQRGIAAFSEWLRNPSPQLLRRSGPFDVAPREMSGVVDLRQTVALERLTFRAVEEAIPTLVSPEDAALMLEALLEYAREVAFSTAEVYARAAEMRGAWDARLEALVVDSVMRPPGEEAGSDESVRTRASALGWREGGDVVVVVGTAPASAPETAGQPVIDEVRRTARAAGLEALVAVQGDRLVAVLGGVEDPGKAATELVDHFGEGPIVVGTAVADLIHAHASASAAIAGLRAAPGWPEAPRPVTSDELLPERALAGDPLSHRQLIEQVYLPLERGGVLDTVATFLAHGNSIEATARALFVHANTVRYRLKRVAELTGLTASNPRHTYTLAIAVTLGRLPLAHETPPTAAL